MEHRENLNKYYRFVKNCKLCKREYGLDSKLEKKGDGICPICMHKFLRKTNKRRENSVTK